MDGFEEFPNDLEIFLNVKDLKNPSEFIACLGTCKTQYIFISFLGLLLGCFVLIFVE